MVRAGCPTTEVLQAFARGELDATEVDGLVGHLESCASCTEAVARLDGQADTILRDLRSRLGGSSGTITLPADGAAASPQAGLHSTAGPPARLGDFRIVREIGRGGMGVVYEAFQGSLNRHVAVKLLREPTDLARFRREARAAGRLHHTNIVPVHGVGDDGGWHYYVMQYIEGRGLDGLLGERRSGAAGARVAACAADFREAARIALQAADALAYAHDQGIIHRDIKPSNLLLDDRGIVWITDFGLAFDSSDTQTLTQTGDLLGTLRYMAPERFAGRGDARADIYGLGATLYELTCGRAAFPEADRALLVHRVLHHEPPRPRQVEPRVPRDLETIVLRAMAREPSQRYATAAELAEDLRRFVEDRPIRARRVGPWERGVRWCRRNPLAAGLLAGLVLAFVVGFASVTVLWRRADAEAARAGKLARAEGEARAAESRLRVRAQAEVVARDLDRGLELARHGDTDLGTLWLAEALRQVPGEEAATARMIRANLAAWEPAAPPLRAIIEHGGPIHNARFRPDGGAVLTGGLEGTARLWDPATGRPLGPPLVHGDKVYCTCLSTDGRWALTGGFDHKVRVWDPATGRPAGPTLDHGERVWGLAVGPGGRPILTWGADGWVRRWDPETGQPAGPALGGGVATSADLSPDGGLLVTCGQHGPAQLWELKSGRRFGPPLCPGPVNVARFSPDGQHIVTVSEDGTAAVWNTSSRRQIASLPRHADAAWDARFSPDGGRVVTMSPDATARISEAMTGQPIGSPLRHGATVWDAGFSPDGRLVATASDDGTARLWEAATGRPIGPPLRHRLSVKRVVFSPDGRLLLTAGAAGSAKVWDVNRIAAGSFAVRPDDPADATARRLPPTRPGLVFLLATISPDRNQVLLAGRHDLARVVDLESGQPVGPPLKLRWPWTAAMSFGPGGARVAIASHDVGFEAGGSTSTACQLWDPSAGRPMSPQFPHINWVGAVAFRPDGEILATGDYSGEVHLWNVRTGARAGGPFQAGSIVLALTFSADGRALAVGTVERVFQAIVWDLASNRPRGEPIRFRGDVRCLAFSGDGSLLAIGSADTTARLVDVATGRVIGGPLAIGGEARGLAFSPDDRLLLTTTGGANAIGAARLWDTRSGQPASPVMTHPSPISDRSLAFSPDGRRCATGCNDGSVRVWDAATARPIGPPRMLRGRAIAVAFGRDGRSLMAVDDRGNVRTWSAAEPAAEPTQRLIDRVRARIGVELDSAREPTVLEPDEWRRLCRAAGDPSSSVESAADADWHENCARDAETIGDGFGARWHLDRLIASRPDDGLLYARRARAWLWSEKVRAADADLARAIERGPHDRVLDWLEHRAADSLADGRPADALRLLDRVAAVRPGDWLAHALRADAYTRLGRPADRDAALAAAVERGADIPFLIRLAAERSRAGRWAEAAALYDRAIAMGAVPYEVWTEAAIAHLEHDDEAGYRRVCEALRGRRPADIPEPLVRRRLAEVLTLGPAGVGGDGKALGWVTALPAAFGPSHGQRKRETLQALGATLFRAGRSAEAIAKLREGIATGSGQATFEETVFMAMASWQAGDCAQAQGMLHQLGDLGPDGPSSEAWWTAQARRRLRREAQRLILDSRFPADPFAP